MTSFAVVSRVRRLANTKRVGHLGTLDPMAEGVLPLALGHATRLIEYVSGDKRYLAEITLGVRTDTLDAEGQEVERTEVAPISPDRLADCLAHLAAATEQIPPMASALHIHGKRAYELFREGHTVDIPPRPVRIDAIELISFETPRLVIDVRCGPGTYIRSVARDVGDFLGCGAHLSALRRTRRGPFHLAEAVSLETLEQEGLDPHVLTPRGVVDGLPWLVVRAEDVPRLRQGGRIPTDRVEVMGGPGDTPENLSICAGAVVALSSGEGGLLAIARETAGELQPLKVFAVGDDVP